MKTVFGSASGAARVGTPIPPPGRRGSSKNPLQCVPIEVRQGLNEALDTSLNIRSRSSKRFRCGFETSEDALTWTVFRFLLDSGFLAGRLAHLTGRDGFVRTLFFCSGAVLFLARPAPARCSRSTGRHPSKSLGEDPQSHSEPDVIVDFGKEGVVVVEAKDRSSNDRKVATYSG